MTNYLGLLDRIQRWRRGTDKAAVFATFNYDRLFEYAVSFYQTDGQQLYQNSYDTMQAYIQNPLFPLLKLHGSVDWGHRVTTAMPVVGDSNGHVWQIAWEVIRRYRELAISPEIEKIAQRPPEPQSGHAYVPALALPVDLKNQFVFPQSHLTFLQECLPKVRSLLIIGWRGLETHFVELLHSHLPRDVRILAVCGKAAAGEETLDHLRTHGIGASHDAHDDGFSAFVVGGAVDQFLEMAFSS